jgi:peptide/nickel transport system substrate-binding protein
MEFTAPRSSRSIVVALVVLVLSALLMSPVAAQGSGVLRAGMNAPIQLDPALQSNDPEAAFNRALYDFLVEITPGNEIVPNLASAWSVSDDGLTYTFTLEEGVTFHDGSALTSADVVYTFNRLKEVGSPAINLLGSEFTVSAPDAATVVFTLPQVNADFLFGVGSRWTGIVKDGATDINVLGEGDTAYANFNGSGPFILSDFRPEEGVTFTANPNYWREGQPSLSDLEFVFIEDPIAQADALTTGAVDFIFKVPIAQYVTLETTDGITALSRPTSQHPVIRLRTDEGFPGADPNVRLAFKYATDRELANQIVLQGRGVIGHNDPISPVYGAFYDAALEDQPYDPNQACTLLSEAGYPDGLELTLYTPDSLGYPDLATVLQQMWSAGCIRVSIEVRPENAYYSSNEWFDVALGITGYGARPTPQQFLVEAYASDGLYNETRWTSEALDTLIDQAGQTVDPAARTALFTQIATLFRDEGPIIIPWFAPMLAAARDTVQGLDVNPFPGLTDFRTVSLSS